MGDRSIHGKRISSEAARRRFGGLAAGLVLAAAPVSPAQALQFVVTNANDSGAGSLRQAILDANASAGPDEVVFSLAGCPCTVTLASTLSISESLTITGPGASTLAVSGNDLVRVFNAGAGAELAISSLTIRNGASGSNGGGVLAQAPLTLTGVTVRNNTAAATGGGIFANTEATLVDCVVRENTATNGDAGGLYAGGRVSVSGSQFVDNQAPTVSGGLGGGGLLTFGAAEISDTDFVGNSTGDWGGGAWVGDTALLGPSSFSDVRFLGNTAESGHGGGLFLGYGGVLSGVEAIGNYAGQRGGGIYGSFESFAPVALVGGRLLSNSGAGGGGLFATGDVTVDGTQLSGNVSRSGNGGGMWTPQSAVVTNATVSGNVVLEAGNSGGIDTGANLTITGSTVSGNQNFAGSGGGTGSGGDVTVTDCEYEDNATQVTGGGLLSFGLTTIWASRFAENVAGNLGGGVSTHDAVVDWSEFEGNQALGSWGGGMYVYQDATVTDTVFTGNSGTATGGGLAVQFGAAQVTGGRFEGNVASSDGRGGGLYCIGPSCEVDGTEFVDNHASHRGGAVAAGGVFSANGALFDGNDAVVWGGAIYSTGAIDLQRSRFVANEADRGGALFHNGGTGGEIANSLFARNRALSGQGDALALQSGGTELIRHSTLVSDPSQGPGSALYVNGGTVELRNSIVAFHDVGIERNGGVVAADFNLFDGNGADTQGDLIVNGNPVSGAPDFLDPESDDYRLTIGSAAVDAGQDAGLLVDFEGEVRPQGGGVDLGYDELSLAAPTGCPVVPAASCGLAASDALQISVGSDPAKSRFTLKHLRAADAIAQADFGNPVAGGNAYQLCLYDASAGSPELVASMLVQGGGLCGGKPCWKAIPGKGFVFKDKAGTSAGVRQLVLRGGDAGKGAVLVKAGGTGLVLPSAKLPGLSYLDADPDVTVQLHESSTGSCWESRVAAEDVQKNSEAQFKALRR